MSPLLRDELRVVLFPDEVLVTRISRSLSLRGLRRQLVSRKRLACDAATGSDPAWAPALSKLSEQMQELARGRVTGTVIVSNHFMRYTVVPWSETLGEGAEQLAYARHCFKQNYGYSSDSWDLCLDPGRPGMPRLASAIDGKLLEALRALFLRAGAPLDSIQPHLMAAYNQCRPALQKGAGWFVLHEPGNLCIALLDAARCCVVRTARAGADWADQLPSLLEREACLAESDPGDAAIDLWAPELGAAVAPECGRFRMRNAMAALPAGFISDYAPSFSVAVSQ